MVGRGVLIDVGELDKLKGGRGVRTVILPSILVSYRIGCHYLEIWVRVLQQLLHHA